MVVFPVVAYNGGFLTMVYVILEPETIQLLYYALPTTLQESIDLWPFIARRVFLCWSCWRLTCTLQSWSKSCYSSSVTLFSRKFKNVWGQDRVQRISCVVFACALLKKMAKLIFRGNLTLLWNLQESWRVWKGIVLRCPADCPRTEGVGHWKSNYLIQLNPPVSFGSKSFCIGRLRVDGFVPSFCFRSVEFWQDFLL